MRTNNSDEGKHIENARGHENTTFYKLMAQTEKRTLLVTYLNHVQKSKFLPTAGTPDNGVSLWAYLQAPVPGWHQENLLQQGKSTKNQISGQFEVKIPLLLHPSAARLRILICPRRLPPGSRQQATTHVQWRVHYSDSGPRRVVAINPSNGGGRGEQSHPPGRR